jgi:RNA polymerase sigma-70 factor (ECF subfamily)
MDRSHQEERLLDSVDCRIEHRQAQAQCPPNDNRGDALEELFGNCMPRLFRVADCVLHNYHDSEDALQDGLLSALRHIDQFRGNAQFSTWLYSIIRNSALAKLRRQRAHTMVSIDEQGGDEDAEWAAAEVPADPRPDPERGCEQSEISHLFDRMLDGLPPNYQAIIRMCDFEGFSGKEAAQRLGLSVSALKAQHHRARLAIRESISGRMPSKNA